MPVLTITKENFETEVLKSDRPVLVDFMTGWCGFCKMIAPAVEKLAAAHPEIKVGKMDAEAEEKIADSYGVMTYPTLMVFKNGEVTRKAVAPRSMAELEALL